MASPMPVLPEVPSMIVPPGFNRPRRSASSIIRTAMRSLIEFPGLNVSSFARTVTPASPRAIELMRTIGVWPMASRMVLATGRGTSVHYQLPEADAPANRVDELHWIVGDAMFEHGFDVADIGNRPRRIPVDHDEIRLLAE